MVAPTLFPAGDCSEGRKRVATFALSRTNTRTKTGGARVRVGKPPERPPRPSASKANAAASSRTPRQHSTSRLSAPSLFQNAGRSVPRRVAVLIASRDVSDPSPRLRLRFWTRFRGRSRPDCASFVRADLPRDLEHDRRHHAYDSHAVLGAVNASVLCADPEPERDRFPALTAPARSAVLAIA